MPHFVRLTLAPLVRHRRAAGRRQVVTGVGMKRIESGFNGVTARSGALQRVLVRHSRADGGA
jgi:hypothetical protein